MPFYDGFMIVNNDSPSVKWRRHLQDTVDKQFENASTWWDDIYEEKEFGSDKIDQISNPEILEEVFNKIEARITSLIDAKSGQRDNDDYKQIIYKDTSYKPKYGQRYYFDNNIWIIYSTENIRLRRNLASTHSVVFLSIVKFSWSMLMRTWPLCSTPERRRDKIQRRSWKIPYSSSRWRED